MMLEVCVDSLISARVAIAGGADRIELCSALCVGGLTPHGALLEAIRQESDIPVRCLMRPRPGDFLYTTEEREMVKKQILRLKELGADGFVIGALLPDGSLDEGSMAFWMDACGTAGVTLHRCIDVSRDLEETYLKTKKLGVDSVLTSGGKASCQLGMENIAKLLCLRDSVGGPEVLIGSGVNAEVISAFRKNLPGATAFHMSGKRETESKMVFRRDGVPMGVLGFNEWQIAYTDENAVRAAKAAL